MIDISMKDFVEENFSIFSAMTIQNRALCDVRDVLKPSQRLCMYSQFLKKITYEKPFQKSAESIAAATSFGYVHGDTSLYNLLARLAKPFCQNYPLEDFEGQYTIQSGNNQSAFRYTSMRLGELGSLMFEGVKEEAIEDWLDNYDNTGKYPAVLPSLGYYNICNGLMGLATGLSSSIPQFNIREVNEAMIKLLWNRDISFEDIYCEPDFCTGGTILNGDMVKESLRNGTGKAIILRSKIEYDADKNCLFATELPYSVYTDKVMEQFKNLIESGELAGIKKVLDLSKKTANIKIELEKGVNVNRIVKELYKKTLLQSSFTINMTMLKNGKRPVVFGWKEALLEHIDHEIKCYTRIYNCRLEKINNRIPIIDGILKTIANIDDVITIIKSSKDKNEAAHNLMKKFNFTELQVKEVLKITLSKLAHLESIAYENEKKELLAQKDYYTTLLTNKDEFYKVMEEKFREVADKFGSPRKTKVINLDYKNDDNDEEPIEKKELLIHFTNLGNIYTQESTTLMTTRRGGKGTKVKLANNETIIQTINDDNFSELLAFTNSGKMYSAYTSDLPINSKINCNQLFALESNEKITTLTTLERKEKANYLIFITKNGMIKKTETSEYQKKRGKSLKAINLKNDDEVIAVYPINNEKLNLLTSDGNCIIIETENINPIGRAASGVKGIKLNENATVIGSELVNNFDKYILAVSKHGYIKKTSLSELGIATRGTKGKRIQKIENDNTVKTLTINNDCDIIITSNERVIKINTSEISLVSRDAAGVKSMKLNNNEYITNMLIS